MRYRHSLGRRFLAYFIDGICIGVVAQILVMLGLGNDVELFGVVTRQLSYLEQVLTYVIYFVAFAYFNEGITVGKMVLGLEVKSADGGALDRNKLMMREVIKSLLYPVSLISFLFVALRQDNKSLHDLVANTITLKQVEGQQNGNMNNQDFNNTYDEYYDDPSEKYEDPLEEKPKKDEDDFYY